MTFFLQYRDATSDTPIIEFRFPFPVPFPQKGERVFVSDGREATTATSGCVTRIEWSYEITRSAPEPLPEAAPGAGLPGIAADIDIFARVWLESDQPT